MRSVFTSLMLLALASAPLTAQDIRSAEGVVSSPFPAPEASDSLFVINNAPYLDTGCLFRSEGPIVVNLEVPRVIGQSGLSIDALIARGIIAEDAELILPAFDVDYDGGGSSSNPERDRISFNGHPLDPPFLMGADGVWRLNSFRVNVRDILFPQDPGFGGKAKPQINTIQVDIDTANSTEVWCTAIDWIALRIEVVRPVAFFHGILSHATIWNNLWEPTLTSRGFLTDKEELGALDSIENNATKIRRVVDRMRTRFGVDKVNIVAHSKGGLDSRHYAENRDTVERVIQLGTPNAGSPLADYIQAAGVIFFPKKTVLLDLALPAGYQLTTWHMGQYNRFHTLNDDVVYTSVAGDYSGAPLFSLYWWLDLIVPSPNDGIVPVASAHSLPMRNLTYVSNGGDMSATHVKIHSALGAFQKAEDQVTHLGRTMEGVNFTELAQRTHTVARSVSQGAVETFALNLDGTGMAGLTLLYGRGDLDLAIVTPDGIRIDASTAPGLAGFHHAAEETGDGLKAEVITVETAQVGSYTVEVLGRSVINPDGEEPFLTTAWLPESTLSLELVTPVSTISPDDDLTIEATLEENGSGLDGASVTATACLEDGTAFSIPLAGVGSGSYAGAFSGPLPPGVYRVQVVAEGTNQAGADFTREGFLLASVASSDLMITPPHTDQASDLDGDGLFDELRVSVGISTTKDVEILLYGELSDATGTTLVTTAQSRANVKAGFQMINLVFDGEKIFRSRVDGPYLLRVARLAELESGSERLLPTDEENSTHTTGAFTFLDFEHDAVGVVGSGSIVGLDNDGNGLFDRAEARIEIEAISAGVNEWSGRLVAPSKREVDFANAGGSVPAGLSTISLEIDGCRIKASGEVGDYSVEDFLFFGSSGALVESRAVAVGALDSNDFECSPDETANLELVGEATPDPVPVGGSVEYTLTVMNRGPAQATNVVLTSLITGPAEIQAADSLSGFCGVTSDQAVCSFNSIPNGASVDVSITASALDRGSIVNEISVQGEEVDLSLFENSLTLEVQAGSSLEIPTLDSVGIAILSVLLALAGLAIVRRR